MHQNPMRIVVTGATGTVGGAVLRRLLADGHGAVAAVRRAASRALPDGAEPAAFDFHDPATYGPALDGAEGLFLLLPPGGAPLGDVVDAAVAAGVRRVAFLSVLGAERAPILPHRAVERRLEASGLEAAFLRANDFMQNLSEIHADDVRAGRLAVPAGAGRTSFVDARDVGDVAAVWLTQGGPPPTPRVEALDLTGPEALDYFDVAETLTDVLGRRVVYTRPGALAFFRRERAAGVPAAFAAVMTAVYTVARVGLADRVTDAVERVLGRPARNLRQFAEDYREAWT